MILVGCDFHSRYQQIASVDTETGHLVERRLEHETGEARVFYQTLPAPARVGVEATGNFQWFSRLLAELGHELLVGDAAKIRAMVVRRQKTDARDASHWLDLLMTDRFPKIWVPTPMENDWRPLLWHRQKLVGMRTSVKNQLHALAMSQGLCRKAKLWTEKGRQELEHLALDPWAGRRRTELLHLLDHWDQSVQKLNQAVEEAGQDCEQVRLLMTHPGVGRIVALAFVLTIGPVDRFPSSKNLVSYLGLNPSEHSSGGRQKLGAISKQGNRLMRSLLVEAAQTTTRVEPHLRRHYRRLKARCTSAIAKVAMARKLAVRLFWMLRSQADYAQLVRRQGSSRAILVDSSSIAFLMERLASRRREFAS
jgi:transposase